MGVNFIIRQIIIAAGQFNQFQEVEYLNNYERWFKKLEELTGFDREQAMNLVIAWEG